MTFKEFLVKSRYNPGSCVTLLLCWIMTSDEEVSEEEVGFIRSFCTPYAWQFVRDFLEAGPRDITEDLYVACRLLDKVLDLDSKHKLIELLFGLVIADNRFSLSELHVIRFIADLFVIMPKNLNAIYKAITGKDLPEPGDPSSREWWVSRKEKPRGERNRHEYEDARSEEQTRREKGYSEDKRTWALSVLGLDQGSTLKVIKQAYRRLCNQHHPDRFTKLGPEAVAAANVIFVKINEAYEILVSR